MVETLRPDVYIQELEGQAAAPEIPVSNGGVVAAFRRGPENVPTLVAGLPEAQRKFGDYFPSSYGMYFVKNFFDQKGQRLYISRPRGAGAANASKNFNDLGGAPTHGEVESTASEPFNLEPGDTLQVTTEAGGPWTATFNATRATYPGIGGLGGPLIPGPKTMQVRIDLGEWQTINFAGGETQAQFVDAVNAQLLGGYAAPNLLNVDITSDKRGTASLVELQNVDPDITAQFGLVPGVSPSGTGDVPDIDNVTGAQAASVIETQIDAAAGADVVSVSVNGGKLLIQTTTLGSAGFVQVNGGTANAVFGFSTVSQSGSGAGQNTTITADALWSGADYNLVQLSFLKDSFTLGAALLAGAQTQCQLNTTVGVERGDILWIDDGTNHVIAIVQSISVATKIVTFAEPVTVPVGGLAIGTDVYTNSQHRVTTQLSAALAAGTITSFEVVQASNFVKGQRVTISDGTTLIEGVVDHVLNNEVFFTAGVALGAPLPSGSLVVSHEFKLEVYDTGELSEEHEYLSMEATNETDYIEVRLSGDSNESELIELTDAASPATGYLLIPEPVSAQNLAGGLDGTVGSTELIGDQPSKSGLYAFDSIKDVNFLSVPGGALSVQQAAADYCTNRGDVRHIGGAGLLSEDTAEEMQDWRLNQYAKDTSFSTIYWPWAQMTDPLNADARLYIPMDGYMQGLASFFAANQGPHKIPANYPLRGIVGLSVEPTDLDQDILNPIGVNVVRFEKGSGFLPMGGRTMQTKQDGKHYINIRDVTTYAKRQLYLVLRPFILINNIDEDIYRDITSTCKKPLRKMWTDGWLVPRSDENSAFNATCNDQNNTAADQAAGRVNVFVFINPPAPAEKIVLRIATGNGSLSIEE